MTKDPGSGTWSVLLVLDPTPDGSPHEYKVALDRVWDVSYGAGGVLGGPNISLPLDGPSRVRFTYDEATHAVGHTVE